jgi:hypothetical protein
MSTDTSSLLDDSLPTEPSLPVTPLLRHGSPKIHIQTPRSGGRMLQGLGIEGLFENNGKSYGGMGLLSERFGALGVDEGNETGEDGTEYREDDSRPSKTFLREVLFTFSHSDSLSLPKVDVFSTCTPASASFATSTPISKANGSDGKQLIRDMSTSTISSELKCLPKKLKAGKAAQKGRRVGPMWKL